MWQVKRGSHHPLASEATWNKAPKGPKFCPESFLLLFLATWKVWGFKAPGLPLDSKIIDTALKGLGGLKLTLQTSAAENFRSCSEGLECANPVARNPIGVSRISITVVRKECNRLWCCLRISCNLGS